MPDPVLPDPPANWSAFMDKVKAVIAAIKDVIILLGVLYAAVKADFAASDSKAAVSVGNDVKAGQVVTHAKQDAAVAKADAVESKVEKLGVTVSALPPAVANEMSKTKGKN